MPPTPTRRPATRCGPPISPARDACGPSSSGAPSGTGPADAGDCAPCRRRAVRRRRRTCDRCPVRAELRRESQRRTFGRRSARAIVPARVPIHETFAAVRSRATWRYGLVVNSAPDLIYLRASDFRVAATDLHRLDGRERIGSPAGFLLCGGLLPRERDLHISDPGAY